MNPVFVILVFLFAILLWLILSTIWFPIGNCLNKTIDKIVDILNKEEKSNDEKEKNK